MRALVCVVLGGCSIVQPCGGGGPDVSDCGFAPIIEDTFELQAQDGGDQHEAKLSLEEDEIVLRWTDAQGARWEAVWERLPGE